MADYSSLAAVRALGITVAEASDSVVNSAVAYSTAFLDSILGYWFGSRTFNTASPLAVDGRGTSSIILPVPAVPTATAVTKITIDDSVQTLTDFKVYNRIPLFGGVDDRRYPRIVRKYGTVDRGSQNVLLEGSFGWCDLTGSPLAPSVPSEIATLATDIAVWRLAYLGVPTAISLVQAWMADSIISESTAGRSITYRSSMSASGARGWTGISRIDSTIARYMLVSSPRQPKSSLELEG